MPNNDTAYVAASAAAIVNNDSIISFDITRVVYGLKTLHIDIPRMHIVGRCIGVIQAVSHVRVVKVFVRVWQSKAVSCNWTVS